MYGLSVQTVIVFNGHFAMYPEKLIEPCILAGSPVGGVVIDPFLGSGTTAAAAKRLGRRFIGIGHQSEILRGSAGKSGCGNGGVNMEVKINQEIKEYNETIFFGLSVRQFVFSLFACGAAVGNLFRLPFFHKCRNTLMALYARSRPIRGAWLYPVSWNVCGADCSGLDTE